MRTTTTKRSEVIGEEAAAVVRAIVPSKMTAAVLYGSEDLRIEKIDVPAVAADEVLLRVEKTFEFENQEREQIAVGMSVDEVYRVFGVL